MSNNYPTNWVKSERDGVATCLAVIGDIKSLDPNFSADNPQSLQQYAEVLRDELYIDTDLNSARFIDHVKAHTNNSKSQLHDLFSDSPFIKVPPIRSGTGQPKIDLSLKPSAMLARIYDHLDDRTKITMFLGVISFEDVLMAITHPKDYSAHKGKGKGRRVIFGRPKEIHEDLEVFLAIEEALYTLAGVSGSSAPASNTSKQGDPEPERSDSTGEKEAIAFKEGLSLITAYQSKTLIDTGYMPSPLETSEKIKHHFETDESFDNYIQAKSDVVSVSYTNESIQALPSGEEREGMLLTREEVVSVAIKAMDNLDDDTRNRLEVLTNESSGESENKEVSQPRGATNLSDNVKQVSKSEISTAVDSLLSSHGSGLTLKSIQESLEGHDKAISEKDKEIEKAQKASESLKKKLEEKESEIYQANVSSPADSDCKFLRMEEKSFSDLFPKCENGDNIAMTIPCMIWDGTHPHIPAVDEDYIFKADTLLPLIYALINDERAYLQGDTGVGKTTLVEQVCARLGRPMQRINFDSEITRMDLLGRDTLIADGKGNTISKFEEGIIPYCMSKAYVLCCDEVDFVRPDVAYVMQRMLEGNGILLNEDGGRMVNPNPLFRIVATANTVGQGDEHGRYQGARSQSFAFLDRFTVWINVPPLSRDERVKLMYAKFPQAPGEVVNKIDEYVRLHEEALDDASIIQPISPRGYLSMLQMFLSYDEIFDDSDTALREAFDQTVSSKANSADKAVLAGIAQRVFD